MSIIVDHLTKLQGAIARGVLKTHAENLRDKDVMIHFEALAKEYDLNKTDTYAHFKANMCELGYTIGTFIKGMNGERIAKRALKLLSYDKGVRILYNVQLEDDDAQAELRRYRYRSIRDIYHRGQELGRMLSNENYRGGSVATAALMSYDLKNKRRSKYLVSDHHEAIIGDDIFNKVVYEKQRRCNIEGDEKDVHRKNVKYSSKKKLVVPD